MDQYFIKSQESDFKSKFKTEICRNWTQGCCEYGDKCIFAHGNHELRGKEFLTAKYRTKKCKQFHELGFCQYGNRCQFMHVEAGNDSEISDAKTASSSPRPASSQDTRKRLPVFVKLAST